MAEIPHNQEKLVQAKTAVNEYEFYTPASNSHDISDLLDHWIEACEGANLAPDELRQVAWMYAEKAFVATMSLDANHQESDEFREEVNRNLRLAEKTMLRAYNHREADRHDQVLIDWENVSLQMLRGYLTGDGPLFLSTYNAYDALQHRLILDVAQRYAKEGGIELHTLGHTLTVSSMIMSRAGGIVPMPTPPRMRRFGIDDEHRSDLILLGGKTVLLTMSDQPSGPNHISLPFSMVRRERGKYTDGLLAGVRLAQQAHELHESRYYNRPIKKALAPDASLEELSASVHAYILEQMQAERPHVSTEAPTTENPFEWYETVSPLRHPYVVDADRLEQGLAHAEMELLESRLSQEGATLAAWMYIESGMGRALQPTGNRMSPSGDFERADFMLQHAYENSPEHTTVDHYDLLLTFAASPIYAAIALGETPPLQDYAEQLATLGENMWKFYAALPDKTSPDALRMNDLIKTLSVCLTSAADPSESWVAVPSSPRQREKWHLAVWRKTKRGFVPQRAGRLALADADTTDTYADGIVAVTPKMLGQRAQNTHLQTLYHLIDHVTATEVDPRELHARSKAIARVRNEVFKQVAIATS